MTVGRTKILTPCYNTYKEVKCMSFEIGQRVVFRSLQWEVADTSSETVVELFGRSEENRGRKIKVLLGLDGSSVELAQIPSLRWTIGEPGWDARQWKAVLATWDIRSHIRRLHQPDFPFLSLCPCEIEGTAWKIEHRSFRLKSSMYEYASRTRQKSGIFISFARHTRG